VGGWVLAVCAHCSGLSCWVDEVMVYPFGGSAPLPNADLPKEIQGDYEEARSILNVSPRGAAALLRLAIQKLCKHIGESGDNLNTDIAALVKKGLLPQVQQSLDAVRVIGNNAVHPGQIDLQDNVTTAAALFRLVNLIADQTITAPKSVSAIYNDLPHTALTAIKRRDEKAP
jgi:hypothetical protein